MRGLLVGLTVAALAGMLVAGPALPRAAADPQDLEPYCTAGQIPTAGECLPDPTVPFADDAPGANPGTPLGLTPGSAPAI